VGLPGDRVRDHLRRAFDREWNRRRDTVARQVEGEAMELVLEGRRFDRPLRPGQTRSVEEDDRRRAIVSCSAVIVAVVAAAARRFDRQFTSFRSTA
jgi:hypothetical protein